MRSFIVFIAILFHQISNICSSLSPVHCSHSSNEMTLNIDNLNHSLLSIRHTNHSKNQVGSLRNQNRKISSIHQNHSLESLIRSNDVDSYQSILSIRHDYSASEKDLYWDKSIHTLHQFGIYPFNRSFVLFE